MCGILAYFGDNSDLSTLMQHRGPDEYTNFRIKDLEVHFYRLSITGESSGKAPVTSEDGDWVVFLNGEIYNFRKLQVKYNLPQSESDTKVIANGLSRMGINFLQELRGMFAGLVIHVQSNRIFTFRDFFGEKPLFVSQFEGRIAIASEVGSLIKIRNSKIQLDKTAIASYFQFGYIEEPHTIDKQIKAIPRGSIMELNRITNNLELFANLEYQDDFNNLDEVISLCVNEAIETKVAYAIALSAGIDSQVVALALSKKPENLRAYIFENPFDRRQDESKEALKIARKLGAESKLLRFDSNNFRRDLKLLAQANDQPHADASGLAYMTIFREMQKDGVKVAYLGHGPDEFMWGYSWYNEIVQAKQSEQFKDLSWGYWNTPAKSEYLTSLLPADASIRNLNSNDQFLHSDNPFKRGRAEIAHSYLAHNGLSQTDRLAMAFSIEPRVPLADARIYFYLQRHFIDSKEEFNKRLFLQLNPRIKRSLFKYKKKGFRTNFFSEMDKQISTQDMTHEINTINNLGIFSSKNIEYEKLNYQDKHRILMLAYWLTGKEIES